MLTEAEFSRAYADLNARAINAVKPHIGSTADAEDMVQSAWTELWQKRDGLDGDINVLGWICSVARRMWWRALHPLFQAGQYRARPATVEIESAPEMPVDGGQEAAVVRRQISDAAEELPEARGHAVRVALMGGDSGDIARIRGSSISAATDLMRRAVDALRKKWSIKPCPTN